MGDPPRIPVWLDWDKSVIYFITICVSGRKTVLASDATFNALKKATARLREWKLLAAVVMDHFTLLRRQHEIETPRSVIFPAH